MTAITFASHTSIKDVEVGSALTARMTADGHMPGVRTDAQSGEAVMMGVMTVTVSGLSQRALTAMWLRADIDGDGSGRRKAAPDKKGIRYGVGNSRQIRNCPRNCKWRATLRCHCPDAGMGRRRQAVTRESGDLPSKSMIATRAGCPGRSVLMAEADALAGIVPFSLVQSAPHQVLICTSCRQKGQACRPGNALIAQLRAAFVAAGLDQSFEVSGTDCMAGCDYPCAVAWRAAGKATWLFGDIDGDTDIVDLVAFAQLYQQLDDGWCRAADRPGKLGRRTLARIPAASSVARPRGVPC